MSCPLAPLPSGYNYHEALALGPKCRRGHKVTKRTVVVKKEKRGTRSSVVKSVIREVSGLSPYERRMVELMKIQKQKTALKFAKKRLGSLRRAKVKRTELFRALHHA